MNAKTATATEPQFLNHYSTSALIKNSIELLNHMEPELENILAKEFEQGLPSDIYALCERGDLSVRLERSDLM